MTHAIDLTKSPFCPDITSTAPSVDGFEVEKLLPATSQREQSLQSSSNSRRGFLAESFIKPPVELRLNFPVAINLHRISIDSKVGEQFSNGFELFSSSEPRSSSERDSRVFAPIGRAFADGHLFEFRNHRYSAALKQRPFLQEISSSNTRSQNGASFALTSRHDEHLCDVTELRIRIRRTGRGSACALKELKVFGYPSKSVTDRQLRELISQSNASRSTTPESEPPDYRQSSDCTISHISNNTSTKSAINLSAQSSCVDIPAEFLDALTFELMVLPMLLPSGYNVDRSSLDRHNLEQGLWGRAPCDPFTAQVFTKTSQPVFNAQLKTRIDEFLLRNPTVKVAHQTVGSADDISALRVNLPSISLPATSSSSRKRQSTEQPEQNRFKKLSRCQPVSTSSNSKPTICENFATSSRVQQLSASLDTALESALGSRRSFTQAPSCSTTNALRTDHNSSCMRCGSNDPLNTNWYRTSCAHLVCRKCLLSITDERFNCGKCSATIDRKSIKREYR